MIQVKLHKNAQVKRTKVGTQTYLVTLILTENGRLSRSISRFCYMYIKAAVCKFCLFVAISV